MNGFQEQVYNEAFIDEINKIAKAKLGSGARFKALSKKLEGKKGIYDPEELAAAIGRKKYGKKKFQSLAKKGK